MTYLFYETPDDLMPQVLTEEQFLQFLVDRKISVLSRLYVPDTRSFVPALEHALLVARRNGINPDTLPPVPTGPAALPGSGDRLNAISSLPGSSFADRNYTGPSAYPSSSSHTGAPRGTSLGGFGMGTAATTVAGLGSGPSAATPRTTSPAAGSARGKQKTPGKNSTSEATSQSPGSPPAEQYYNQIDSLVEKYTVWYAAMLVRHQIALLLIPLAGMGLFLLRRVRRDEKHLQNRLAVIGINRDDWQMMIQRNILLSRRQATLRPLSIYAAVVSLGLLFAIFRLPVVQYRLVRTFSSDTAAQSLLKVREDGSQIPKALPSPAAAP